jgi:K+-sensing histidine kinase KdpD
VDVVVGVVETHGRRDTEAMLHGARWSRAAMSTIWAIRLAK